MRLSSKGFTLIEVMVAAAVLGVGCMGVLGLLVTSMRYGNNTARYTEAVNLGEQVIDRMKATNNFSACGTNWKMVAMPYAWYRMNNTGGNASQDGTYAKYTIHCRQVTGSSSTTQQPYVVRVSWRNNSATGCSEDMLRQAESGKFADLVASDCEYVMLPVMGPKVLGG